MRVLSVAFPEVMVGAASSGGSEQILSILDAGLVERGCDNTVIAAPGSRVSGRLIESIHHRETINFVLGKQAIDIIHFHGLDFHRYLPETDVPMLATLHLPVSFYPENVLAECRSRGIAVNCVSRNQANASLATRCLPVIPNGIPTRNFLCDEPSDYLLWLGRICPEKGVHLAIEVARRRDSRLIIAGPVYPYPDHQRYFENCVKPLLDEKRIWIGPVDAEDKRILLSRAYCVLAPSLVAETCCLVAMEALSSGTPVVAFRRGALPDIVDHGETGFLVDSVQEMIEMVSRVDSLSRALCRERALARFDSRRMIEDYLTLYRQITTRRFSTGRAPHENL